MLSIRRTQLAGRTSSGYLFFKGKIVRLINIAILIARRTADEVGSIIEEHINDAQSIRLLSQDKKETQSIECLEIIYAKCVHISGMRNVELGCQSTGRILVGGPSYYPFLRSSG